jgi:hypothetical protein
MNLNALYGSSLWLLPPETNASSCSVSSRDRSRTCLLVAPVFSFALVMILAPASLRVDVALHSGVGRSSGVSVWRRRGNRNARGGPSGDLTKLGLDQSTVSRFVHLLACPGSVACGSHILTPFAEMSEADMARSQMHRSDGRHRFMGFWLIARSGRSASRRRRADGSPPPFSMSSASKRRKSANL